MLANANRSSGAREEIENAACLLRPAIGNGHSDRFAVLGIRHFDLRTKRQRPVSGRELVAGYVFGRVAVFAPNRLAVREPAPVRPNSRA